MAQAPAEPVDVAAAVADMDRWVFMSDVCKHCTNAGCMDACPTGALIRTEFETVVLQPDVCNGCGYCIPSCPFGVVDRSPEDGRASKCTLCYDRLEDGLEPACAKACPTDSIQFGPYEELVDVAQRRVATLQDRGLSGAYLYGAGDAPGAQLAGGLGAFFLLTEPPERYGLPAEADSPIQENVVPATLAAVSAGLIAAAGVAAAFRYRRAPVDGLGALTLLAIGAGALEIGRESRDAGAAPRRHAAMRKRQRELSSERDMRPAVGAPGGPASWRRAVAGAAVGAASARLAGRAVVVDLPARYGLRLRGAGRSRARRSRPTCAAGAASRPAIVQGPMMKAPVWSREVPLYFWFGGMAAGASFVGLACDLAGDERSARVARKVALGRAAALAAAADPGPRAARALLQHVAHLQAALADVDGLVVPDAVRWPGSARRSAPTCSAAARRRARWARPPPWSAGYLGSYTGVLLASTAVPVWARSRLFLGPIFVSTATLTGAAATRLVLTRDRRARRPSDARGARPRRERRDGRRAAALRVQPPSTGLAGVGAGGRRGRRLVPPRPMAGPRRVWARA